MKINLQEHKSTDANGLLHSFDDEPSHYGIDLNTDKILFQYWHNHGKLHRENDLPAIIYGEAKHWYYNDVHHRLNGRPAIIYAKNYSGEQSACWYYDNRLYFQTTDIKNVTVWEDMIDGTFDFLGNAITYDKKLLNGIYIKDDCTIEHYKDGLLHDCGGAPAVNNSITNTKIWYENGLRTKADDLLAIYHYKNGLLHREGNLPAIEYKTGAAPEFWLNGKRHELALCK